SSRWRSLRKTAVVVRLVVPRRFARDCLRSRLVNNQTRKRINTSDLAVVDVDLQGNIKDLSSECGFDDLVRDLVERCTCPVQFPMIRVSEGKYRIGDTKVLIFVRVLRNHVMVRVGGGWDTLSHYLDKHDPCRCKTAHRSALSTKLILKSNGPLELNNAQVYYERSPPRTRRSSASSVSSGGGGLPVSTRNRSRSPSVCLQTPRSHYGGSSTGLDTTGRRSLTPTRSPRSRSPTPRLSVTKTSIHGGSNTGLDVTGRTSRNRSRSPTPRPPSRNKNSPADNNNNEGVESTTTAPPDQQSLNDSGSEVSDEGYRSLGIVGTSAVDGNITKGVHEENKTEEACVESEDAQRSERPIPPITTHRPPSECSSCEEVPPVRRHTRTPSDVQQQRRLSDTAPSTDSKMTRSRSTGGDPGLFEPGSPARRSVAYRSVRADPRVASSKPGQQNNTWSGRQGKGKPRPSLSGVGFERNTTQRRSLGATNSAPSTPRRHKGSLPSSLQGSPTKQISPLIEQILQVKELDNDVTVLNKMKEIIQQYADIVDMKLDEEKKHEGQSLPQEELDITSAWVHGNGSLGRIRKVSPTPRKDSKTYNIFNGRDNNSSIMRNSESAEGGIGTNISNNQ
ncbi:hypothetical protein L9F63_022148, partial [Diploptera punctata]